MQNEEGSEDEDEPSNPLPTMPSDPPWLAYSFPFASAVGKTAEGIRGSLMSLLPRASAAREICDIYYRHAAWLLVSTRTCESASPDPPFYVAMLR